MTYHVRNCVHVPPTLSMLLRARARDGHCQPETVLREAVFAFAALSPDVRQLLLHEYHWKALPSSDWQSFYPDADTLKIAGLAKLSWSKQQTILAAVSWFLVAW